MVVSVGAWPHSFLYAVVGDEVRMGGFYVST
jgi:hypothetical protein